MTGSQIVVWDDRENMELEQTLQHFGLEEKEAIVYLACLQLGKDTAFHIAERCKLKRSTVYVILKNLNVKSLISISKTTKATLYDAVSPKRLLQQLETRKHQLEESLPLLLALHKDRPEKPKIQVLEGEQAIDLVYRESIEWARQNEEILAFGTLAQFGRQSSFRQSLDIWLRAMKDKRLCAREMPNDGSFEREYIRKVKQNHNPNHQTRVVPEGTFANDNLIYGNKLAIFSVEKDLFVTLIESAAIVKSYRNFFDLAWQSARPT